MVAGEERHALFGHAVLAAEVAALGDRDAQIGVAAPEPVEEALRPGGTLLGESVRRRRLGVHGYGALRRWGERKLHGSCITPRRPKEKARWRTNTGSGCGSTTPIRPESSFSPTSSCIATTLSRRCCARSAFRSTSS